MPRRKKSSHWQGGDRVLDAPVASSIDLHGLTAAEATVQLHSFMTTACRLHRGKVIRIITGRGRGSASGPVLRPTVARLLKGPLSVFVADFSIGVDEGSYLVLLK